MRVFSVLRVFIIHRGIVSWVLGIISFWNVVIFDGTVE
jgi:hypothetical protein